MAEVLLGRVHSEIRARLRECEAAVREYELLEAALNALTALGALDATTPKPEAPAARRRRTSGQSSSGARAARGANRAAVLRVLGDRPGVSVTELASASGVARPVLYNLLKTLAQRGEIAREDLPGGATGNRIAAGPPADVASGPTSDQPAAG
jgi:hypothetical protein